MDYKVGDLIELKRYNYPENIVLITKITEFNPVKRQGKFYYGVKLYEGKVYPEWIIEDPGIKKAYSNNIFKYLYF